MKRRIIFLFTMTLVVATAVCCFEVHQTSGGGALKKWHLISSSAFVHGSRYSDIHFFDTQNGVALGGLTIEITDNGGKDWKKASVEDDIIGFYSMAFTDAQRGLVVGSKNHEPVILTTRNAGVRWELRDMKQFGLSRTFSKFTSLCRGSDGTFWISGDGGIVNAIVENSHVRIANVFSTDTPINGVFCSGEGPWAVGEAGLVLHYETGKWASTQLGTNFAFQKVLVTDYGIWVIGGDRTEDDKVRAGFSRPGVLFRSLDGGHTWRNQTPTSANWLNDIYFQNDKGWLVGNGGDIYHSDNAGRSWTRLKSPTESDLLRIFVLNSTLGWISGTNGVILKSTE